MATHLLILSLTLSLCVLFTNAHSMRDVPSFLRRSSPSESIPYGQFNRFSGLPADRILSERRENILWTEPQEIEHHGWFSVQWEDISIPYNSSRDYLALYLLPDGQKDVPPHDYLDILDLLKEGGTWPRGMLNFTDIPNVRGSYFLRYFRLDASKFFIEIARSNLVRMKHGKAQPVHIHLSISSEKGDHQSPNMHLLWTSGSKQQYARFGTDLNDLHIVESNPKTYTAEMMCEEPATIRSAQFYIDVGHLHRTELRNLFPNTQYFYQVGSEKTGWSDIFTFKSAPKSSTEQVTRLAIFGDMGVKFLGLDDGSHNGFSGAKPTVHRLIRDLPNYDLVLHIGDISYAWSHGYVWEMFMSDIEPISQQVPYMINVGNHEHDYSDPEKLDPATGMKPFHPEGFNYNGHDSGGECSIPTAYRFGVPTNGNNIWWYSFDQGNIHVIMFSTEHDYRPGSTQYEWMKWDLASVDRNVTPWVIVGGHRPPYTSQDYPSDFHTSLLLRESIEDLLVNYDVDLAVWGHYHSYERTCAVRYGECVNDDEDLFDIYKPHDNFGAPIHVTVGTAGIGIDYASFYEFPWSVFRGADYGYLWVETHANRLHGKWIRTSDGYPLDEFTIHK